LIICPACEGELEAISFDLADDHVVDGVLRCSCGASYPIVRTVPRLYDGCWSDHRDWADARATELARSGVSLGADTRPRDRKRQTQESFGYQWTAFSAMTPEFEENFRNYLQPIDRDFFRGRLGLDAGCGFGRHIFYAATYGAEMVGVDYSAAIESSRKNTAHLPNVHLVQADIYRLPFRAGTFDFAYSLGVLHHLPEPFKAYLALKSVVKPGGICAVWLYSKTRRWLNRSLEVARRVTPRLPYPLLKALSFVAALVDWGLFIWPYRVAASTRLKPLADRLAFARVKVYAAYPFHVTYADWFDRLSPPIRFYYDEDDLRAWARDANVEPLSISPTGKYGWRLQVRIARESTNIHTVQNRHN
jgi:SAM-dependent methyltransferase/uncharacterized protein YbaR (Trm112 family)